MSARPPHRRLALSAGLLAAAVGCNDPARPSSQPYDGPLLLVPAPTSAPRAPSWTEALPAAEQSLTAGDQVWAAIPSGDRRLEVAVYRVVGRFNGLMSLLDSRGQRVDEVPPALVHRAEPLGKLKKGDVVLCSAVTAPGLLGRVTNLEGAIYVTHRWGDTVRETAVDHAERPRQGLVPLAYASFSRGGNQERGLIVALSDKRAWLRDASGEVASMVRAQLSPMRIPRAALKKGQEVAAYGWTRGMRQGQISEVLTEKLRYRVRYADGSSGTRFFDQLELMP